MSPVTISNITSDLKAEYSVPDSNTDTKSAPIEIIPVAFTPLSLDATLLYTPEELIKFVSKSLFDVPLEEPTLVPDSGLSESPD